MSNRVYMQKKKMKNIQLQEYVNNTIGMSYRNQWTVFTSVRFFTRNKRYKCKRIKYVMIFYCGEKSNGTTTTTTTDTNLYCAIRLQLTDKKKKAYVNNNKNNDIEMLSIESGYQCFPILLWCEYNIFSLFLSI